MCPFCSASRAAQVAQGGWQNEAARFIVENVLLYRRGGGPWPCRLRILVFGADPVLGRAQSRNDASHGCTPGGHATEQIQGARAEMDRLRENFDLLEARDHRCGGRKVRRS